MSVHYDVDAAAKDLRAQLAAVPLSANASAGSRIRHRNPELVIQHLKLVLNELNRGERAVDILEAFLEEFADNAVMLLGGKLESYQIELIGMMVAGKLGDRSSGAFCTALFEFEPKHEPGGHA